MSPLTSFYPSALPLLFVGLFLIRPTCCFTYRHHYHANRGYGRCHHHRRYLDQVVVVVVPSSSSSSSSFSSSLAASDADAADNEIEYQSDESKYGRGEMHLSATLDIGDLVVYQTGTWYVDGVEVGDGTQPPQYNYGLVETIQLVWTHNCEHGVIRALPLQLLKEVQDDDDDDDDGKKNKSILQLLLQDNDEEDVECIEFGPEQLIAKLPMKWWDEETQRVESTITLDDTLWEQSVS